MATFFRKEVVDRKLDTLGSVCIVPPRSHRLTMHACLALAGAFVSWLVIGTYTRRVHVSGHLIPAEGLITVHANATGTVARILVHEGQRVSRGDPIAVISSDRSSTELGPAIANVTKNLRDDKQRIEADRNSANRLNIEQIKAHHRQLDAAKSQLNHLNDQVSLQQKKVILQETLLEKIKPLLAKGYISVFQLQQHQANALEAQSELRSLFRQGDELRQRIADIQTKINQQSFQLSSRISELDAQQSVVNQSLARTEVDRELTVTAPSEGSISAIHVKAGQSSQIGQAMIALVPKDSKLVAQLLIKSNAVGFVKPGTQVALHLKAFPYQKFGIHKGVIKQVSHSALSSDEVTALLKQKQVEQEPLYRVEVDLQSQTVVAYGNEEHLRPGMVVEADMLLDRRHLVEWLFEPLLGARERWKGGIHGN